MLRKKSKTRIHGRRAPSAPKGKTKFKSKASGESLWMSKNKKRVKPSIISASPNKESLYATAQKAYLGMSAGKHSLSMNLEPLHTQDSPADKRT